MTPDQTRKRFAAVVKKEGEAMVAVRLQCSVSQIRSIIAERRNLGLRIAIAIEEAYGIPAGDWVDRPASRLL